MIRSDFAHYGISTSLRFDVIGGIYLRFISHLVQSYRLEGCSSLVADTSDRMFTWLIDYLTVGVGGWTYPLAFLLVALDALLFVGFLLPGEAPVLLGGGTQSGQPLGIGALAALGSIVGDSAGYWLGIKFAER
jgi:hypothetical protein